jgi:hypothetical protein
MDQRQHEIERSNLVTSGPKKTKKQYTSSRVKGSDKRDGNENFQQNAPSWSLKKSQGKFYVGVVSLWHARRGRYMRELLESFKTFLNIRKRYEIYM